VVGVYFRCLAGDHPRSWLWWRPWVEYSYNTSYQSSLQTTPFKVVFCRDPPTLASYQLDVACVMALDKQLQPRDEFLGEIRERLLQAQDFMKSYDKGHNDLEFAFERLGMASASLAIRSSNQGQGGCQACATLVWAVLGVGMCRAARLPPSSSCQSSHS
jgi:hypothetical protein